MSKGKKKKLEEQVEHIDDEIIENIDDDETKNVIECVEDRIRAWLNRVNFEALTPTMYVYKTVNGARELCGKFIGEDIPDDDAIGMRFGSGNYMASLKIPAGESQRPKQTSFGFRVSAFYDQMRKDAIANGTLMQPMNSNFRPVVQSNDKSFEAFQEGMRFTAEMMSKFQPPQNHMGNDVSKLLFSQYSSFADALKVNLMNTNDFLSKAMKEMKNEISSNPGNQQYEEIQEEENPLIKILSQIIPLVAPLLSSANLKPAVQAVAQNQHLREAAGQMINNGIKKVMKSPAPATSPTRNIPPQKTISPDTPPGAQIKKQMKKTMRPAK